MGIQVPEPSPESEKEIQYPHAHPAASIGPPSRFEDDRSSPGVLRSPSHPSHPLFFACNTAPPWTFDSEISPSRKCHHCPESQLRRATLARFFAVGSFMKRCEQSVALSGRTPKRREPSGRTPESFIKRREPSARVIDRSYAINRRGLLLAISFREATCAMKRDFHFSANWSDSEAS